MTKSWEYRDILPAMQCPFRDDLAIDEEELRRFSSWLLSFDGIGGLVTNGHTGEVFALTGQERADVTRIVAEQTDGRVPVVSGLCCEGITEAQEHARLIREAGGDGLLVMPPHYWLRFGMRDDHVMEYFTAIGESSGLDLIVHVYPSWTRAAYSCDVLARLAELPYIRAFKVGTREMNKYARDIKAIRDASSKVTILTCHDEYLLPSMVQGIDGALVGFGSFIPEMITRLWRLVQDGNLHEAIALQQRINPLKDVVYGMGEPTGDAHARMKLAMVMSGRMKSARVQPPMHEPGPAEAASIRRALADAGLLHREAAE